MSVCPFGQKAGQEQKGGTDTVIKIGVDIKIAINVFAALFRVAKILIEA
jgi:hypothetical protein